MENPRLYTYKYVCVCVCYELPFDRCFDVATPEILTNMWPVSKTSCYVVVYLNPQITRVGDIMSKIHIKQRAAVMITRA